jgi:hypothetical protein
MAKFSRPLRTRDLERWIGLIGLLSLSAISKGEAADLGIRTEGTCVYRVFRNGAQTLAYSSTNQFSITLDGCSWEIRLLDPSAADNPKILDPERIVTCDGTNIFSVALHSESATKAAWGERYESVADLLPRGKCTIYLGTYPPPAEPDLQHVWLGYAARCVLSKPSGKARSVYFVQMDEFEEPALFPKYTFFTDAPGTQAVKFETPNFRAERGADGRLEVIKVEKPFPASYTTGVGQWTPITLNQTSVSNFTFTAFAPRPGPNPTNSDLIETYSFDCVVTNITKGIAIARRPLLPPGSYETQDRRFLTQGFPVIEYRSTNRWLEADDPQLAFMLRHPTAEKATLRDEAAFLVTGMRPGVNKTLFPYRILLGLIALIALIANWFFRSKNSKQIQEAQQNKVTKT